MTHPMFASIRKYDNAPQLSEELFKRQDDVKSVLRPIRGFHAYYLVKTTDGAVSMTLCEDRAGVEESDRVAATWLKNNLPTFANRTPEVTSGEVRIQLEAEMARVGS
jgi:hypothetical protein